MTFALDFKPEWAALFTLGGGISDVDLPSLKFISDATPADPLMASLSDGHCSSLECFSRGSMLDSKGRPPAYQSKALTTWPPATGLLCKMFQKCPTEIFME